MTHRVVYSQQAKFDLANIERHIADSGSPDNAATYIRAIVAKCDGLAAAPYQGTRRDDVLAGLRTTGFRRRVTIAFFVGPEAILIARILYGGRDIGTNL